MALLFCFLTTWAMIAHLLYMCGLCPCTFLLAVFVLLGAIVHNVVWNHRYNIILDLLSHYLPVLLFLCLGQYRNLGTTSVDTWVFNVAIVSAYVCVMGPTRLRRVYITCFGTTRRRQCSLT